MDSLYIGLNQVQRLTGPIRPLVQHRRVQAFLPDCRLSKKGTFLHYPFAVMVVC